MVRRSSRWLPVLISGALGALFVGCGGTDQSGLFSPSSGVIGSAGANGIASAGASNAAGGHTSTGGTSSAAGSNGVAGSNVAKAGSGSGGGDAVAGSSSIAGNGALGGGSANGGATGNAGGGGASGGNSAGGNNAGGNNTGGSAGANSAGAGGSGGMSGGGNANGGSGGAGNPGCQDLLATAAEQLAAARACDSSGNAAQCTGKVNATCGCQVPVESDDSPETKAYLATLALIEDKHCVQVCPQIACVVGGHAECKSQAGSGSLCVATPLTPVN